MTASADEVPRGFARVQRRSPFLDLVGSLYRHEGTSLSTGCESDLSTPTTVASLTAAS